MRDEAVVRQRSGRRLGFTRLSLIILALLMVVRVTAAVFVAPQVVADAQGYDASALRLIANGSFAYPLYSSGDWGRVGGDLVVTDAGRASLLNAPRNAYTMPGFPAFLAVLWRVIGATAQRFLAARVAQAVLSVLTAALIYLIGIRFGPRVGHVALVLSALYPPLTLANSYLLTEVLYTFLLTLFVWVFLVWLDGGYRAPLAIAAGAAFSAGMWVRPTAAIWIVLAWLLVLVARRGEWRAVVRGIVVMGVVAAAVIAPWWVRNYGVYHRVVPFTTSEGVNTPQALLLDSVQQSPFPWQGAAPKPTPEDEAIGALAQRVVAGAPTAAETDAALIDYYPQANTRLMKQIRQSHLWRVIQLRTRSILNAVVTPYSISPLALRGYPFLASWIAQLALLAFFVVGMVSLPRTLGAWLIASLPVYFLVVHMVLIPINRYLFPVAPVAIVIAALGFSRLRAGSPRARTTSAGT